MRGGKVLPLRTLIRVQRAGLLDPKGLSSRGIGNVEGMPAGVKFRLDHDYLFLPGDTVDIDLDKRIALVERLHVGICIRGLKRAIESNFFLISCALDQDFLPVLGGQFFKFRQNLAGGLLRGRWRLTRLPMCKPEVKSRHPHDVTVTSPNFRTIFNEALALLDFLQDRWIDEVAGVEIFHLRAGLGELIDDGLNTFATLVRQRADKSWLFGPHKDEPNPVVPEEGCLN